MISWIGGCFVDFIWWATMCNAFLILYLVESVRCNEIHERNNGSSVSEIMWVTTRKNTKGNTLRTVEAPLIFSRFWNMFSSSRSCSLARFLLWTFDFDNSLPFSPLEEFFTVRVSSTASTMLAKSVNSLRSEELASSDTDRDFEFKI